MNIMVSLKNVKARARLMRDMKHILTEDEVYFDTSNAKVVNGELAFYIQDEGKDLIMPLFKPNGEEKYVVPFYVEIFDENQNKYRGVKLHERKIKKDGSVILPFVDDK